MIGDRIYHKTAGVCVLQEIRKLERNGEDYWILSPCFDNSSTLYVPSSRADLLLRPVISETAARTLIANMPELEPIRFSSANERKQQSAVIMKSGDCEKLARLSKTYYHAQFNSANIRSSYSSTQTTLRQIEKLLFGELAAALGIEPDAVLPYIEQQLTQ